LIQANGIWKIQFEPVLSG